MIVCLDSGNSRIKWGVHDGKQWLAQGAVAHAEVEQLRQLVGDWPHPAKVMLANVAGAEAGGRIREQLAPWLPVFSEARSEETRCGVTNQYRNPAQLGVDRWCALIGARGLSRTAAIVVMAGTATTVDTLDADGNFLGGLILPGGELMRRALAVDTAALPFANGSHADYPRCTDDAIVTGCIEAQVGAVERAWQRLGNIDKVCLLSGGNAASLAPHLGIRWRSVANLPMEGLLRLALDA
ncbi:type III pantothenate kinase [Ferribacterium limneticum]|uniref:type III pantothenate kinase n=1 Tax=Ferribacterium limneticum TaxID=76259 RepID=UPI001CF8FB97|nr:type III pantothenate kinase [Ferribacterium limneticum]UCV22525.1 type III pantothenate kinase [Ferribacterium limneticum]